MAPELVQDLLKNRDLIDEYSPPLKKSVDVYAFGVLVFEVVPPNIPSLTMTRTQCDNS